MKLRANLVVNIFLCFIAILSNGVFAEPEKPSSSVVVETAIVKANVDYEKIAATGTIIADPGVVVRSEIAGRILKIRFTSGNNVEANDPLVEIDSKVVKSKMVQAQAELKLAQLQFQRLSKLRNTKDVSEAEYDKVKSSLELCKSKLDEQQATLDQTLVRAPFAGRLGISQVSVGQYVKVGQDLVSLQALKPIYVDFTIPEAYVHKVVVGQKIDLHVNADAKRGFSGTVSAIDPLINKQTRSLFVRGVLANDDEKLLPGTFADIVLYVGESASIVKIPQTAVFYDQGNSYVYKVADNKAVKTAVVVGKSDAQDVEVKSGLKIDEVVVIKGQMNIHKDGTPVVVAVAKS